ncbi:uncharacterized protein LOC115320958 isoform X2 [Ixodes scapularis]|uniref:uncharacterized protein LOC115320958 isoform X2 n=1 Tax=Ixodes scapularis TaxID=6945 RepID=UPI001C389221|nr:uncharacterized protein LOC115320958 isoform X2 [Ixodes scapularis]
MRDVDERSAAGTDCGNDERPRRGEASPQELEDAPDDGTGRLGNTDWCLCGSCAPMETVVECVCCREYPAVARKQQGRQGCVTGHPDFEALCLNPEVFAREQTHHVSALQICSLQAVCPVAVEPLGKEE